jgi:lipopolysaccharide transport system ATP-binding protein
MSDEVGIEAEGLGKKYMIGHAAERERYVALRDVIARGARSFWRKTADMAQGRVIIAGDTSEEFWALKDVSFEVKRGEVLGIIGRNGAGKTTLLKILSRITKPSEGRVTIRGRVASLLEVGTGFHPELSGRENIYLNGAILGMSRREVRRKFDEIVAFAEVEKFLDTPVKRYSSGMYVRLAFAVAAHLEPEILVVDEVLAVGDFEFQKKCLGKMSEVAGGGRTVLFVSHNMSAVTTLCQKAILLSSGTKTFEGDAQRVVREYTAGGPQAPGARWTRPDSSQVDGIRFEKIAVSLSGEQPALTLACRIRLRVTSAVSDSFLAIDIMDALGTTLMQALPKASPFIPGTPGCYDLSVEIFLPPLIPGIYALTFWLGPHNTRTYDAVENELSFQVIDSPSPGRTYPHHTEHGYIVPPSRCSLLVTTVN